MNSPSPHGALWPLNPAVAFLNHGSFGATPTVVLQSQRRLQDALERDPVAFLAPERELEPKLDAVRAAIASLVHADPCDVAFVHNATDGVNAVLRSFPLQPGDDVVVTNHGYNACINAVRYAAARAGARLVVAAVSFPLEHPAQVTEAIQAAFTDRTRLLLVDHVTSPTALVFPIRQIIVAAHQRGIRVMVDGAHAPGMVPVDLTQLDADYYTANHHKWLCAPKASGFLYVRRELQDEVRPTVISHAANQPRPQRSRFLAEFDWTGTYDPTALLATHRALSFLEDQLPGGLEAVMARNHQLLVQARERLCTRLSVPPPAPDDMLGSMASVPLPVAARSRSAGGGGDPLQRQLFDQHQVEVPIFPWPDPSGRWLRISAQLYNDPSQYERLADALPAGLDPS